MDESRLIAASNLLKILLDPCRKPNSYTINWISFVCCFSFPVHQVNVGLIGLHISAYWNITSFLWDQSCNYQAAAGAWQVLKEAHQIDRYSLENMALILGASSYGYIISFSIHVRALALQMPHSGPQLLKTQRKRYAAWEDQPTCKTYATTHSAFRTLCISSLQKTVSTLSLYSF